MSAIKTLFKRFTIFTRRARAAQVLTTALIASIIVSAVFTYISITNPDRFGISNDPGSASNLLILNIALLLMLAILVSRKLINLYSAREKGRVGSRLLMKLVIMFSLVAIVPSIVVGLSSSFYLNLGIKSWFDERVSNAVQESVKVADAYLKEHKDNIRTDAINLSNLINSDAISFAFDTDSLGKLLDEEAARSFFADAVIFHSEKSPSSPVRDRTIIANAHNFIATNIHGLIVDPLDNVTDRDLDNADKDNVVLIPGKEDKVTALIRIRELNNAYLLVSRYVDDKVLQHTKEAHNAADEYEKLKNQIANFQVKSTIFFVLIAIFLLLAALWMAFRFANNLVAPVTALVSATDRVKRGEYSVRVKEGPLNDEIAVLSRSFNQMASELEQQKRSLILAKREAEERNSFTEAVLSDLTSGVMAIDNDKRITLLNRSAKEMLDLNNRTIGKFLRDVAPEFLEVVNEAEQKELDDFEKQISIRRKTKRMNFLIRTSPQTAKNAEGYILTFDDITELVSAQRSSAWSDVAQKIAHEIKNPLTPINLSAQRLAKKYTKFIPEEERENFEGYTNTIARHTTDIANIITGFSNFAKMPAPKFSRTDLSEILKDAVFSARVRKSKIDFTLDMPDKMETVADPSQISQVLTNIIKNAAESVTESKKPGGNIKATARMGENITITIDDNGKGFPDELIDRLTEPYVTTRTKGTGLGLAIVKKIMQDHHGKIELTNIRGGARVVLTLPIL